MLSLTAQLLTGRYPFSSGFEPEPLAESLSQHTPVPIPYQAPVDYAHWATIGAGVLTFLLTLRFIMPIITSRWIWAAGTVITSLVMTSGFMFTRIRGVPYTGGNGNWIAAGYQNQYGQEVQVIALICEHSPSSLAHVAILTFPQMGSSPSLSLC